MSHLMPILFTGAMLAYPIWKGASYGSFRQMAIYAVVVAAVIFFNGPKSHEIEHNPPRWMLAVFSLIGAVGLTGLGYGIGYLLR